jgi:RNA polymerase sigma-B factor
METTVDDNLFSTMAAARPGSAEWAAAREQLVIRHLPLAYRVARRYAGRGEPLEDLRQVAVVGLIKSVDAFSPERNVPFPGYAVPKVIGELWRHFRDRVGTVRIPYDVQEARGRLRTAWEQLAHELGREPDRCEIARKVGLPEGAVAELLASYGRQFPRLADSSPIEVMRSPAQRESDPECDFAQAEIRAELLPVLSSLNRRELRILRLRFAEEMSQTRIAQHLGISQMHVSRLLHRAITDLREQLGTTRPASYGAA